MAGRLDKNFEERLNDPRELLVIGPGVKKIVVRFVDLDTGESFPHRVAAQTLLKCMSSHHVLGQGTCMAVWDQTTKGKYNVLFRRIVDGQVTEERLMRGDPEDWPTYNAGHFVKITDKMGGDAVRRSVRQQGLGWPAQAELQKLIHFDCSPSNGLAATDPRTDASFISLDLVRSSRRFHDDFCRSLLQLVLLGFDAGALIRNRLLK